MNIEELKNIFIESDICEYGKTQEEIDKEANRKLKWLFTELIEWIKNSNISTSSSALWSLKNAFDWNIENKIYDIFVNCDGTRCYKFNIQNVLRYLNIDENFDESVKYDIDSLNEISVTNTLDGYYNYKYSEEDIENSLFGQLMKWLISNNIAIDGARIWVLKDDFHNYYREIWNLPNSKFPIYRLEVDKILEFLNISKI